MAWCGLEWDPACLEFHKTRRPVRTASAAQVRQPIYSSSVGRWKNYELARCPPLLLEASAAMRPAEPQNKKGAPRYLGTPWKSLIRPTDSARSTDQYMSSYPPWPPPPAFFSSSLGASAIRASEVRSSVLTLAAFCKA